MKNTVRLNFEFPREEYPYLKMLCAEKGLSFKEFATELFIKAIEEYEDHMLTRKARKRMKSLDKKDNIPFDKACDLAGWDDESKL
jgi:predicted DNA-binding protein